MHVIKAIAQKDSLQSVTMQEKVEEDQSTVANKKTRRLGIFSTRKFELLKSCPTLTLLPPNKGRLEVSKNVRYVSVAQWAAKLQLVKLEVIFHKV